MTPLQVSEKFWRGIEKKNITLVTIYSVSKPKIKTEDLKQLPAISNVSFGKIIIDADQAEIETFLTITSDDEPTKIIVNTVLVNRDSNWKVKYHDTMLAVSVKHNMAEIVDDIQEIAEGLSEEIEASVERVKKEAIPEIKSKLEQAEEELREALPGIKNKLNQFLKNIEKSIKESFPVEEEPKTQET